MIGMREYMSQRRDMATPATLKSAPRLKPESEIAELLLPEALADGEVDVVLEVDSSWLVVLAHVAPVTLVRVLFNCESAH